MTIFMNESFYINKEDSGVISFGNLLICERLRERYGY